MHLPTLSSWLSKNFDALSFLWDDDPSLLFFFFFFDNSLFTTLSVIILDLQYFFEGRSIIFFDLKGPVGNEHRDLLLSSRSFNLLVIHGYCLHAVLDWSSTKGVENYDSAPSATASCLLFWRIVSNSDEKEKMRMKNVNIQKRVILNQHKYCWQQKVKNQRRLKCRLHHKFNGHPWWL